MDEHTTDPPDTDAAPPQQLPVPRTGEDGKPVYDQEFFLELARCGKDVWNRWRKVNPEMDVTFVGVDFTEADNGIDFSNFEFGNLVNFSACRFGDGDFVSRTRKVFAGGMAKFTDATFGNWCNFSGSTFGERTNFVGATFGNWIDFDAAFFGYSTDFSRSAFKGVASFSGAAFHYGAVFERSTFNDMVFFNGDSIDEWKRVRSRLIETLPSLRSWPQDRKEAFLTPPEVWNRIDAGPDAFGSISFSKARFLAGADFSRRKFKGVLELTSARFDQPPSFDSADRLDNVDLYGTRIGFSSKIKITARQYRLLVRAIPSRISVEDKETLDFAVMMPGWTTKSEVANELRHLRGLAEGTHNHDLERDLYIEERKAERGIVLAQHWVGRASLLKPKLYSHCLWIVILAAFSVLADYGRSFVRPLAALVLCVPVFWWAYAATLIPPTNPTKLADFRRAAWAFAISNAVPFVGALTLERDVKLTLLCGDRPIDAQHAQASGQPVCVPIPGRRFQLLALGQSIFSALCIFFAGLALRNYFKLR